MEAIIVLVGIALSVWLLVWLWRKNIELLKNRSKYRRQIKVNKMRVICPNCQTAYQVDVSKVSREGTYAKCKKCKHRFLITINPPEYRDVRDYRVPGERMVLYISLSCLVILFFVLLKINLIVFLLVICISVALVKIRQGQLLGQTVKVSKNQFPKIYEAAKTAATRLSMNIPDVFIKYDPVINAFALGFLGKKSVILHSKTVESMEDDELISILGHELTHIRCNHTSWIIVTNSSEGMRIPILSDIMGWFFRAWSRKAEFTADRGGLLASRNVKASISALCKIAVGENLYNKLNLDMFIGQEGEVNTDKISKISEKLSTHPYTVKRIIAIQKYYDSESYKKIVQQPLAPPLNILEELSREVDRIWNTIKKYREMYK